MRKQLSALLITLMLMSGAAVAQTAKHSFAIKDGNFLYDGKPVEIHSGEMHFARVPAPYWRHRLQMMKAMGLNAVATYVFWNYHETAPGVWDFKSENRNIREFIKTAGEEGLMVILRPGPYACAEWEFGGYPWWLQKTNGLVIRTDNKLFLDSCKVYISNLANQVRDLQITKGGPVIMVQAENEFGSYVSQRPDIPVETHKKYSAAIRKQLIDAGFDIPMFTSDGSWLFKGGAIEGALPTANGEDNVKNLKKVVDEFNGGKGPYMVAEFYPGWLDHWGEPFQKISADKVVKQTKKYLDGGVSFNLYMVHGGTNFGFTAGANNSTNKNIQPDITSYDYDAPISEAGWATPKYMGIRDLMKQYVKYDVPAIPNQIPVIEIPDIQLQKSVNLMDMVSKMEPVENDTVMTFEDLNQGHGYVLYRRHFNQPIKGEMKVTGIRDYAIVYVNGKKIGELNRVFEKDSMDVDIPFNGTLDILVENMGRINYGAKITENLKGIISPVMINGNEITGSWEMFKLPMDKMPDLAEFTTSYKAGQPVIYEGEFKVKSVGDTFLDMQQWGKGIVFINGFNIGRYWKVGPQQTLYVPGCLLKKGSNKIVVFEQLNDVKQVSLSGVKVPVLDKVVLSK
ncbi:beta-galactosidase [uncultured Bacteroides sp.]|uniref:beta-galactosidase n=1 Tax=uncultured Bacteroides sp. TaxID=162156 RepID=UPI002AABAAF0|nr:beta-galactosidase [uncultured Bacteroides sp.]